MATDVIEEMKQISKGKFDPSKVYLLQDELYPGANKEIPDPWYGQESGYHLVFDLIDKACDALIKNKQ